jgi:hypothetical protein
MRDRKQHMPLGLILLLCERVCTGLQYAHDALHTFVRFNWDLVVKVAGKH